MCSLQVLLLKRKMSSHGSCLALGLDVVYSKVQVYDWKGVLVYSKVQMDCVNEKESVDLLQDENV